MLNEDVGNTQHSLPSSLILPHVMQHAAAGAISETRLAAPRTGKMWIIATASNDLCGWQIFGTSDALGGIWRIQTGTRHGNALLGQMLSAWKLRHLPVRVMVISMR